MGRFRDVLEGSNAGCNAGFTAGTPWIGAADNYRSINAEAQLHDPNSVYSFYKQLVALRKQYKVISEGKIEFLYPEEDGLLAYRRYDEDTELLVLCSLLDHKTAVTLPAGWEDAERLLSNYPAADRQSGFRPYECLVLRKRIRL